MIDFIPFGADQHGAPVRLWRLRNSAGAMACISELGATLVRLDAPDRYGQLADVTLGFENAAAYLNDNNYLGCIVGRYAGRIAGGRFDIDGIAHQLPCNEGGNLLHGGAPGFHRKLWRASIEGSALRLDLTSPAGEAGFPGDLHVTARYTFSDDFFLDLQLDAHANATTPLNLTHHGYWNLAGAGAQSVLDHSLSIAAAHYMPLGANMIPTGEIESVTTTPLDFRSPKPIGRDIHSAHAQLDLAGGFDHMLILDGAGRRPIATLAHHASGRWLTIASDLPCLQIYSLNGLDAPLAGKGGALYSNRAAIALEPQGLPSAPPLARAPLSIIVPGETYRARVTYEFGAEG